MQFKAVFFTEEIFYFSETSLTKAKKLFKMIGKYNNSIGVLYYGYDVVSITGKYSVFKSITSNLVESFRGRSPLVIGMYCDYSCVLLEKYSSRIKLLKEK